MVSNNNSHELEFTATHPDANTSKSTEITTTSPAIFPVDVEDGAVISASVGNIHDPPRVYITGWRLYILTFALCLSLFLSTLETTIVSTSLVSITNALGGFDQRDWIVVSYLLTYTGFLVIYAKFSDILGRKAMLLLGLALFTVFSVACGSISSMLHLIIFRAFQGIGGSGIYAMVTVINPEMVPKEKWGLYVALISLMQVFSSVLGPILGGVINDSTSWRWVFLLNGPAGATASILVFFAMPTYFPNHGRPTAELKVRDTFTRTSLARLDLVGAFLLLAFSILLAFGFEEAGTRYAWNSPVIIVSIVIGLILILVFVGWEHMVGRDHIVQEPVFPLPLMKNRLFVGLILTGLFTGPPFMTMIVNLPQRYQAVNGVSAFQAGIRLLPLLLSSPFATAISGYLLSKRNIPPFYLALTGAVLQLVGVGFASSGLGGDTALYGYEFIMGFSFGMTLVTLVLFVPLVVGRTDMPVGMAAVTQIRVLGGTIGLAISTTILNNYISPRLASLLNTSQLKQISASVAYINDLPAGTQEAVREVYKDGYREQFRVMLYFCAVVFLSTLLMWERRPRSAKDIQGF